MTDKEIIKALEYCVGEEYTCENCPFQEIKHYDYENEMFEIMPNGKQYDDWSCERWLNVAVFDLIKRQQAEIEKLKGWENLLKAESHAPIKAKARAEAIKEFTGKAKEKMRDLARVDFQGVDYYLISKSFFDNLVKEMVGSTE